MFCINNFIFTNAKCKRCFTFKNVRPTLFALFSDYYDLNRFLYEAEAGCCIYCKKSMEIDITRRK